MTNIYQRHQILASLDSLDPLQREKVLEFIKELSKPSPHEAAYQRFKREAMKEIRQALGSGRTLKPSF